MASSARALLALVCVALLASAGRASPILDFFAFSDLHYDANYDGSISPATFCRRWANHVPAQSLTNGTFGRYGCDTPLSSITSMLEAASDINSRPAFILLGGDYAPHNATMLQRAAAIEAVADLIHKYFPHTPVAPVLGNNDLPEDYYLSIAPGPNPWLASVAGAFQYALSFNESRDFALGGYYHRQLTPGLRLLAINTIYYSMQWTNSSIDFDYEAERQSFSETSRLAGQKASEAGRADPFKPSEYGQYAGDDPVGQFAWLERHLADAEKHHQKVYIAGHMPPGYSYQDNLAEYVVWNATYDAKYEAIVLRYRNTIAGQFFSHLHRDTFRMYWLPKNRSNTATAAAAARARGPSMGPPAVPASSLVGAGARGGLGAVPLSPYNIEDWFVGQFLLCNGPLTPSKMNNPSFRIYYADQSGSLLDYDQYFYDLWMANVNQKANWTLEYTFTEAYGVKAINPSTMNVMYKSFMEDTMLMGHWMSRRVIQFRYYRQGYFCAITYTTEDDFHYCVSQAYPD